MARTPRDHFHEIIEVHDLRDNPNRAEKAVDEDIGVSVWSKSQGRIATFYRQTHDLLDEKIDKAEQYAARNGFGFNVGIAYRLSRYVEKAEAEPYENQCGYQMHREGKILMDLKNPGCRIWLTQADMCEKLECSRSALTNTLRAMKEVDLILNWGEGWIEFDCLCVWRGKIEWKMAYARVQKLHSSKKITIAEGSNG